MASTGLLRKKKVFTLCHPIPGFIPRQVALDVLRDHGEIITLNPLVTDHIRINPPAHAAKDELQCFWYEIHERIQFVPGMGSMGSSKVTFTGCFHDMPWGLQTHMYVPMGIDLRAQYRIAGSQSGTEPSVPRELGLAALGAPEEGLYLRTDIEFISNVALSSFVRKETNAAIKEMVNRIVKRAEQMDAEELQRMLSEERTGLTAVEASDDFSRWTSRNESTISESSPNAPAPQYSPQPQQLDSRSISATTSPDEYPKDVKQFHPDLKPGSGYFGAAPQYTPPAAHQEHEFEPKPLRKEYSFAPDDEALLTPKALDVRPRSPQPQGPTQKQPEPQMTRMTEDMQPVQQQAQQPPQLPSQKQWGATSELPNTFHIARSSAYVEPERSWSGSTEGSTQSRYASVRR
jgi:hypothetical protein